VRSVPRLLRKSLAALLLLLPGLARAEPPSNPWQAHHVVLLVLERQKAGSAPDPLSLPLVPRLKQAWKSGDFDPDTLPGLAISGLETARVVEDSSVSGQKRRVTVEITAKSGTELLTFTLDQTSGAWLITDIAGGGKSLRGVLGLSP